MSESFSATATQLRAILPNGELKASWRADSPVEDAVTKASYTEDRDVLTAWKRGE